MNKKFELLLNNKIDYKGKTLYRIKALRDFGYVLEGDIGGYVESEENLSDDGRCWVYNDAKVYDNARIYGNAQIYDDAEIYDDAKVFDDAFVFENAKVFDDAIVFDISKIHGDARVYGYAEIYDNTVINKGDIIGKISMPYKDIFQHQCRNRMLTAILTENDEILYAIGCKRNITEKEFIDRIYNEGGGLEKNPHREEYLKLIPLINLYFWRRDRNLK